MAVSRFIPQPYNHFLSCYYDAKAEIAKNTDVFAIRDKVKAVFLAKHYCTLATVVTVLVGVVVLCTPHHGHIALGIWGAICTQDQTFAFATLPLITGGGALICLVLALRIHSIFIPFVLMLGTMSYCTAQIYPEEINEACKKTEVSAEDRDATEKWIKECTLF